MAEHTSFAYWLKHRYADWRYGPFGIRQLTHPERRISVFSRWLDVELDVLVCWMCGERPDPNSEQFKNLVSRLGVRAYDFLEMPRPAKPSLHAWYRPKASQTSSN